MRARDFAEDMLETYPKLTASHQRLYLLLSSWLKSGDDFKVTPAIHRTETSIGILAKMRVRQSTFNKLMSELRQAGLVKTLRRGNQYDRATYQLTFDPRGSYLQREKQEELPEPVGRTKMGNRSPEPQSASYLSDRTTQSASYSSDRTTQSASYSSDRSKTPSLISSTMLTSTKDRHACLPESETHEKVNEERVLKNDQKQLFNDDSIQRLVDQLNDALELTMSENCLMCLRSDGWDLLDGYDEPRRICRNVIMCADAPDFTDHDWCQENPIHTNCKYGGTEIIPDPFTTADFDKFGGGDRVLTGAEIGHVVRRVVKVAPDSPIGLASKILAGIAAGNETITRDLKTNLKTGLRNIQF